jgi:hypothetical protein
MLGISPQLPAQPAPLRLTASSVRANEGEKILRFPSGPGARPVTPGNEGSERDAMTATRLGRVGAPEATGLPLDQPLVIAGSRSAALAMRLGLAGVAVASAVVGWVLFGDTNPTLWWADNWPVRQLMAPAIAFSIGGAVLLGYRKARWPAAALLICGLLAGIALLFAGLWWDKLLKHGGYPLNALFVANGIATGLFIGLSLAVLPQLYPDGPIPGRLWKVLLGVAAGLVVFATLQYGVNFPTIDDQVEWYFWSTVVGLSELIALGSLFVRWHSYVAHWHGAGGGAGAAAGVPRRAARRDFA